MNISALSVNPLTQTPATSAVGATTDSQTTSALLPPPTGDSTQLSKMGELMSQLQNLESTDPTKAKSVLTSIASQLTAKASADGGDPRMTALANKFTQAANTGDLSALKPQGAGGHHHHHHGGGGGAPAATAAGSSTSQTATYSQGQDPMSQVESIISNALQTL